MTRPVPVTRSRLLAVVIALAMGAAPDWAGAGDAAGNPAAKPAPLELKRPASPQPWHRYKVDTQGSAWPQGDWAAYSTLARIVTPPPEEPLHFATPIEGDPVRGRQLAFDRSRGGSCVACHIFGKYTPPQPGNVGPDLSTVSAGRSDDYLFNYVYDPRLFNKTSIMPPWGAHRIFNVAEIKDVVAFLKSLKEPHSFKDPEDNPATRMPPKETRDNLDPTENPAMFGFDHGRSVFGRAGASGKSCASCHAAPETQFKTWVARMPRYEPRLRKVVGVEEFITRHARATTGDEMPLESADNLGLSVYLHNLANGARINPDLSSAGAKQALKHGRELLSRKIGQLNMACNDCHVTHANQWARGQYLPLFKGTIAHFPTWRTGRADIWDIRKRFQWCNVSVRANELPPDAKEYGDLELALAVINKGEKINSPGIRQ